MSARKRRSAMIIAVPLGLVASGALVYQSSSAAFTSSTSSATQAWTAGTVVLADNTSTTLGWTAEAGLKPGATQTRCVLVTYTGNLAANVSLYPTSYAATNNTGTSNLEDNLKFTVAAYDGNVTDSSVTATNCSASLGTALTLTNPVSAETAKVFSARTNFTAGARTSTAITGTHYLTYKLTYLVDPAATDQAQADSVALKFTWEAQNT